MQRGRVQGLDLVNKRTQRRLGHDRWRSIRTHQLIAKDWKALSRSYQDLYGCTPVPPVRDFKGADLERGTGIPGAELRGEHLLLPGHGPNGPTLEIFNYNILKDRTAVGRQQPWIRTHRVCR